ncbi:hybrid sensor histidine kinase/response regulator [Actinoplanes flavus]|uniref:histidine kinase n=1 Tax=Actinoplanes flavus TaxID=2820290 RepID=A0ABS3UTI6_9ACTN|nr:ATP-binding protein [Actinoplanes flavus]MBO3741885.1 PAS domain S-box protein [Actinoplanes flavus]
MRPLGPASEAPAGPRSPHLMVAFVTVTVLAVGSALSPPHMLLFGMVAIGTAFAGASARPRGVLAVGCYAFVAAFAVSTWQGMLGTPDQILRLLLVAGIIPISWAIALHLRLLLRATAEAAGERGMLAAIVEQSTDAIIALGLDGTVLKWNAGAEGLYGYRAAEMIGESFTRVLPAERLPVYERWLAELNAGKHVILDEAPRIRSDGTAFLVSVAAAPIRDESGRVIAAATTERDITAKKRREAEERQALERSARAARMESLGQLAGGVAHDFNNLLAIILNYADFLTDEVTADGRRDLDRIRDAADRARSLTGQLLLFARQEPTQVENVDLNEVVSSSSELLSRSIGTNIELVCRTHDQPLPVRANRGRLDQILLNLVINARDAMPDGGMVVVGTGPTPDGGTRLTVADTGCGMTAEVRDRLFEPFFTTKPADRGTGLGLATVYGIVEDAGGHIGVESSPGAGTTFTVELPRADGPAPGAAGTSAAGPSQGHGEHVVVLEDEDFVRDAVLRILRENGFRTTALNEHDPAATVLDDADLLIADIALRHRSGPEVAAGLRRHHPGLRVLFMSGYSERDLRDRYQLDDSVRIVPKPFTAAELLAAVGDTLAPTAADSGRGRPG